MNLGDICSTLHPIPVPPVEVSSVWVQLRDTWAAGFFSPPSCLCLAPSPSWQAEAPNSHLVLALGSFTHFRRSRAPTKQAASSYLLLSKTFLSCYFCALGRGIVFHLLEHKTAAVLQLESNLSRLSSICGAGSGQHDSLSHS